MISVHSSMDISEKKKKKKITYKNKHTFNRLNKNNIKPIQCMDSLWPEDRNWLCILNGTLWFCNTWS